MASPTADEFLSYVHPRLVNPNSDPAPGSSTKLTMRYRWRTLRHWDVEADMRASILGWSGRCRKDRQIGRAARILGVCAGLAGQFHSATCFQTRPGSPIQ